MTPSIVHKIEAIEFIHGVFVDISYDATATVTHPIYLSYGIEKHGIITCVIDMCEWSVRIAKIAKLKQLHIKCFILSLLTLLTQVNRVFSHCCML